MQKQRCIVTIAYEPACEKTTLWLLQNLQTRKPCRLLCWEWSAGQAKVVVLAHVDENKRRLLRCFARQEGIIAIALQRKALLRPAESPGHCA
ncbi:MAG: hypothetical protein LBB50_06095 [Oscillospiraceae bacterium]|jgi:hypothetical protein|nr:hypothetical protein [Oscillospiraceae bacterium]